MFRPLNKVKPVRRGTPCSNIFFSFFSRPFQFKVILKTAELQALCNLFISSIHRVCVPQFAMFVFMCIYLHYRLNKQWNRSFEFS